MLRRLLSIITATLREFLSNLLIISKSSNRSIATLSSSCGDGSGSHYVLVVTERLNEVVLISFFWRKGGVACNWTQTGCVKRQSLLHINRRQFIILKCNCIININAKTILNKNNLPGCVLVYQMRKYQAKHNVRTQVGQMFGSVESQAQDESWTVQKNVILSFDG